jgi:transcriptional regulator with XRE-family HTH domain
MEMKGARIASLRRQAGMSQARLAELLGVSPSAVGMYEQGRREPSSDVLVQLGRIFGVSVDYILTGSPSPQEEHRLQQLLLDRITAADQLLRERKDRPFTRQELTVLFAAMLIEP